MADNPIKYSDLFQDDGAIDALIRKIQELEKVYSNLSKSISSQLKIVKTETEKLNVVEESQTEALKKQEAEIEKLTKAHNDLKTTEAEIINAKKQALKVAKTEQDLLAKRNALMDETAIKNEELKIQISELNKKNKEQAKINLGLISAYEKESKTLNELRKKYKDLAVEGKENTSEAKKLLTSITALDEKLKAIDKTVGQTQREVGNYKEAVKDALKETNLFGEGLGDAIDKSGKLGAVIGKLSQVIGFLKKMYSESTAAASANAVANSEVTASSEANTIATELNTVATEASILADEASVISNTEQSLATTESTVTTEVNTAAVSVNTQAVERASLTQRLFSKSQLLSASSAKILNTVLKASVIGLIITGLSALVAVLSKTKQGTEGVSVFIAGLSARFEVFVGRLAQLGSGIFKIGASIVGVFTAIGEAVSGDFKKAGESFNKVGSDMSSGINEVSTAFDGMGAAMDKAALSAENLERRNIENIKQASLLKDQISQLNRVAEKNAQIESDSTRSFKDRREAILANRKAVYDADVLSDKILQNEVDRLAEEKRLRDEAGTYNLEKDLEFADKKRELFEDETSDLIALMNFKTAIRELEEEEINNNLDILNNVFIARKKINELIIKNDKESFDLRSETIAKTKQLQIQALTDEVAEIQKTTKQKIDIDELLKIEDTKLLNQKIRSFGLSQNLEKELLKAIKINLDAINDLSVEETDLFNKRTEFLAKLKTETEDFITSTMDSYREQETERERLRNNRAEKELAEQFKLAEKDIELTEALNLKKEQLEVKHQENLNRIEIDSLIIENDQKEKLLETSLLNAGEKEKKIAETLRDEKIRILEEEIKRKKELTLKSGQFDKQLIDDELELARLKSKKLTDIEKERLAEQKQLQDLFVNSAFDAFSENIKKQQDLLDKQSDSQKTKIEQQQELAKNGQENTLAFEEAQLAKLEQEKIKAQKKLIQLEKIKSLYAAYSSAASSGDANAVGKALRDFAIMNAIEASVQSFGDGTGEYGTVADAIDAKSGGYKNGNSVSKGIVRGEKHNKRGFGIPVLVEGNEGIWKGSTMSKFGKDNFMQLTSAIDSGVIGSDFFQNQIGLVPQINNVSVNLGSLKSEMNEVRKAIENKPVQQVDVENLRASYLDIIETKIQGNKRSISRYRVNKPRL